MGAVTCAFLFQAIVKRAKFVTLKNGLLIWRATLRRCHRHYIKPMLSNLAYGNDRALPSCARHGHELII